VPKKKKSKPFSSVSSSIMQETKPVENKKKKNN